MEYERTSDGQIQAAFAFRAGQLLLQYETFRTQLAPVERFEATLAVALLQSMLTSCIELLRRKRPPSIVKGLAGRSLLDDPTLMGLEPECVMQQWPSRRGLTYRVVFECLRHALSHPGVQDEAAPYARTGFTTVQSTSGQVEVYQFTHSPWVNNTGRGLSTRFAPTDRGDASRLKLEQSMSEWARNADVDGLSVERDQFDLWRVFRQGAEFVPVLSLRLGVRPLRTLTLTLSDILSIPLPERAAVTL